MIVLKEMIDDSIFGGNIKILKKKRKKYIHPLLAHPLLVSNFQITFKRMNYRYNLEFLGFVKRTFNSMYILVFTSSKQPSENKAISLAL